MREILRTLGWTPDDDVATPVDACPGRVSIVHGANAEVIWTDLEGRETTSICHFAVTMNLRPVAGDWVGVRDGHIVSIAPRRTALRRPDPNQRDVQVLAANIDLVLLVVPIDRKINLRMLERLSIMAWDSGAQPVAVLTKSDESKSVDSDVAQTVLTVPGINIVVTSSLGGQGIDELRELLHEGVTAVMLGASGAGKTSLLNALEGTVEFTRTVSRSGEGRHATTTRKLWRLSCGGVLLDIPGIRLLDLMVGHEGLNETFADITELAQGCRFRNCNHSGDDGCAVQRAVESGELARRRLESYRVVETEIAQQERRRDLAATSDQKERRKP